MTKENLNNHPAMNYLRHHLESLFNRFKSLGINPNEKGPYSVINVLLKACQKDLRGFIFIRKILSDHWHFKTGFGVHFDRLSLNLTSEISNSSSWFPWRSSKPIYRFWGNTQKDIINSKMEHIEWSIISNLPYPGIYVEYEHTLEQKKYIGFFVSNQLNDRTKLIETVVYSLTGNLYDGTIPAGFTMILPHIGSNIIDSIKKLYDHPIPMDRNILCNHQIVDKISDTSVLEYVNIIKLITFICSNPKGLEYSRPQNTEMIASSPTVITALREWSEFRENHEKKEHQGGTNKPHMRSGHFHGYWVGVGRTEYKVKWVAPYVTGWLEIESDPFLINVKEPLTNP